ncbi:MAG: hypothetical protein H7068_04180 [Pedobacter sp.]|nr:hypothetical protein [Chitinophagaceae bacterium]
MVGQPLPRVDVHAVNMIATKDKKIIAKSAFFIKMLLLVKDIVDYDFFKDKGMKLFAAYLQDGKK